MYGYPLPEPRIGRWQMLAIGVVSGALLIGLAWVGRSWFSNDAEPTTFSSRNAEQQPQPDTAVDDEGDDDGADQPQARCDEVWLVLSQALEAAAPSMEQWEVHIGAMNQLVTGAITAQQAHQFWEKTREGAWMRLDAFEAVDRRFQQRTARCPKAGGSQVSAELRRCSTAVALQGAALRRARVALDTWGTHVRHMDMLRDGEMTAAQAAQLWLRTWPLGDQQVKDYRAAVRKAGQASC